MVDGIRAKRIEQRWCTNEWQARSTDLPIPACQLELLLRLYLCRALLEARARVREGAGDEGMRDVGVRRGPHTALEVHARVGVPEVPCELLARPRVDTGDGKLRRDFAPHPFVDHFALCTVHVDYSTVRYVSMTNKGTRYFTEICIINENL